MRIVSAHLGLLLLLAVPRSSSAPLPFDGVLRPQPDGTTIAYLPPPAAANHASTIEQLPSGALLLAWFTGVKEEAAGCAIAVSRLPAGGSAWSTPVIVSEREGYSNQNPVLFWDAQSQRVLLFHSQLEANAGEGLDTIWSLVSHDEGLTWSAPVSFLDLTPLKKGVFTRNRIIPTADGGLLFPLYYTSVGAPNSPFLLFAPPSNHSNWGPPVAIQNADNLVQPSIVRTKPTQLTAFFRDRKAVSIFGATSHDEGRKWTTPTADQAGGLPNNNAGIEAFQLLSNATILLFNDKSGSKGVRTPMTAALSRDGGLSWPVKRNLQVHDDNSTDAQEFSYPTVLQTPDGTIHGAYTYDRACIKLKASQTRRPIIANGIGLVVLLLGILTLPALWQHSLSHEEGVLHVILVCFNPVGFASRWTNTLAQQTRLAATHGVILYTVELAYDNAPFVVTTAANARNLQLRLPAGSTMWHKEALINAGVARLLPQDWRAMAFVDAEVVFDRSDWALAAARALAVRGGCDALQPFTTIGGTALRSLFAEVARGGRWQRVLLGDALDAGHPGYALAIGRGAWERLGGLFPYAIVGAGDLVVAAALLPRHASELMSLLSPPVNNLTDAWYAAAHQYIQRGAHPAPLHTCALSGALVHTEHGSLEDRQYLTRHSTIADLDPLLHLRLNKDGLPVPTADMPLAIMTRVRAFLNGRREDGGDSL